MRGQGEEHGGATGRRMAMVREGNRRRWSTRRRRSSAARSGQLEEEDDMPARVGDFFFSF
jgi:hypothetical protein